MLSTISIRQNQFVCFSLVNKLQSLRGMVDILPSQIQRWQAVELAAREHFYRSGFQEIRTPLLEVTELFSRSIGEATDVVSKEMYTFSDRGDRSCTLRPEGTASVVRSVIEHGLLNQGQQRFGMADQCFGMNGLRLAVCDSFIKLGWNVLA